MGQCIRFPVTDVRRVPEPQLHGRARMRWRRRHGDSRLSILRHVDATSDERAAISSARARCAAASTTSRRGGVDAEPDLEEANGAIARRAALCELSAAEQFVSPFGGGYGKRTSSFEYRTTVAAAKHRAWTTGARRTAARQDRPPVASFPSRKPTSSCWSPTAASSSLRRQPKISIKGPQDPRRDRVRYRGGRAGGFGRAGERGGERRRRVAVAPVRLVQPGPSRLP